LPNVGEVAIRKMIVEISCDPIFDKIYLKRLNVMGRMGKSKASTGCTGKEWGTGIAIWMVVF